MVEYPPLIKRPILVRGRTTVVAVSRDAADDLLE